MSATTEAAIKNLEYLCEKYKYDQVYIIPDYFNDLLIERGVDKENISLKEAYEHLAASMREEDDDVEGYISNQDMIHRQG